MKGRQSWVTYASTNLEGVKALVLARSLKRLISSKDLFIFVADDVSNEIRDLLEDEFDRCICLGIKTLESFPGLKFAELAKIYVWKLKNVEKFVFLDCNCMAVQNSDGIFKTFGSTMVPNEMNDGEIHSVFAGIPSKLPLETLSGNVEKFTWKSGVKYLDEEYNVIVNGCKGHLAKSPAEISIVNFTKEHPVDIVFNFTNGKHPTEDLLGLPEKYLYEMGFELLAKDQLYETAARALNVPFKQEDIPKGIDAERIIGSYDLNQLESLKHSVAIIGMAFRLPGANNAEEFWNLLVNGEEGIIKVPENRWTLDQCTTFRDGIRETEAGFLKCAVDDVDGRFFGLSVAELSFVDPQQRITLHVMHEALENAGIDPVSLKNTNTGVYGGCWRNDYKEMLQDEGLTDQEFFRAYMGNSLGTLTGRISHILETTGPSVATESGCSTSMVSVDMACKSLRNGDCDLSITFGVNLLLHPFAVKLNEVIAVDGRCKTFDESANGFGRAEGCAVLILKRFPDAVRDNDRIWAVIRGSAVVQEGLSKSMGTPTVQCEALAMELALKDAGVKPYEVSFVETHGTGTIVGDPLEVAAVAQVYSRGRKEPLVIGSVKTNIGHTESCSGIAGIIKTVLALQNELIPPHRNFTTLNPEINLDSIPALLPLAPVKWEKNGDGTPRIAGVSSYGITGTDAHVIVQEVPNLPKIGLQISDLNQSHHILTISSKSQESLDESLLIYSEFLNETKEKITDVTSVSNISRANYSFRAFIIGANAPDMMQKINSRSIVTQQAPSESPKICFLFTGQGSQYHGMARTLYEQNPTFRVNFDACNKILLKEFDISIIPAIWGDKSTSRLEDTLFSQTSIFCIEYCLLKLWTSWGIKPDVVLGHSLGEFAAAVAAGVLRLEDALKLVAERRRLIQSLPGGKMIVLKIEATKVDTLMKKAFEGTSQWLDYAAVNSPDQVVLAGDENTVRHFASFCENNNIKTHILNSSHAFHSRHMEPILKEYENVASSITYSRPICTYVSGMDGQIVGKDIKCIDARYWVRHTRDHVRFMEASKLAIEEDCTIFLEIGPQPVLSALTLINSDDCSSTEQFFCVPSIRKNEDNWVTMLESLGKLYLNGVDIKWKNYNQYFDNSIIDLPSYCFQKKSYWIDTKDNRRDRPIHTLVGIPLNSPSSEKIFQNDIGINKSPFLKDHVVGEKILFPGAGFIEMCSVAGYASTQCSEGSYVPPVSPFTIENFIIESPLGLHENELTTSQVIVSSGETGESRVEIYSKLPLDEETHKWVRHASAIFQPYAVRWESEGLYKNNTLEQIKSRCSECIETDRTYRDLEAVGILFGKTFQTLTNAWKCNGETLVEVAATVSSNGYISHPVIIDAMFQATMMHARNRVAKKLYVPVSVQKFIWYRTMDTSIGYIHINKPEDQSNTEKVTEETAILYDNVGNLCAVMIHAELIETTVSSILSTLDAQKASLPSMYEDTWREQLGPFEKRGEIEVVNLSVFENLKEDLLYIKELKTPEETLFYYDTSNCLYLNFMLKAVHELGWNLEVGKSFELNEIKKEFKVIPNLEGLLRYVFLELSKESYFEVTNPDRENMVFKVLKQLPSIPAITSDINALNTILRPDEDLEIKVVSLTASKLAAILTGDVNPLPIIFQEGEQTNAEIFYKNSKLTKVDGIIGNFFLPKLFERAKRTEKQVSRFLEVGAGTGSFTSILKPYLEDSPANYEYTYTDISPAFFPMGEKVFKDSKIKVIYKTLNIEEDPLTQGFIPGHYDVICANYVVHATKNIREALSNMRNLLRPGGVFILTELLIPYRASNLFFGTLHGFWRFQDFDLRPYHCEIGPDQWESLLRELSFDKVAIFPGYMNHSGGILGQLGENHSFITKYIPQIPVKTWIVFGHDGEESMLSRYFASRIIEVGRHVIFVTKSQTGNFHQDVSENQSGYHKFQISVDDPTHIKNVMEFVRDENSDFKLDGIIYMWGLNYSGEDYYPVCRPFFEMCKVLSDEPFKLLVYTQGLIDMGNADIPNPAISPVWGIARSIYNEMTHINLRCIDLDPQSQQYGMNEGFAELFIHDGERSIAYRGNKRHVLRLTPFKAPKDSISIPKSERFHLVLPSSNSLSDLKFAPIGEKPELGDNDVEARVETYALNFRDLFAVLKPDAQFENLNTVGIDYAGIITRIGSSVTQYMVGDAVFGANLNGDSMGSHIISDEELVLPIPQNMTFCEASTLPTTAATSYQCLVQAANLREGETVLIHTGSGGVGSAAIQLAQSFKCRIITTAGSHRKRAYLRNLGIQHVFHSRTTDFQGEILKTFAGPAVDVVLNSLTGPGFKEASLAVCKPGARFIEMSKLNTWTVEEVKSLRPDVAYQIVDISAAKEDSLKKDMVNVKQHLNGSNLKPIPYVRFDASDIKLALTWLQKAKHIGKIVCVMPSPIENKASGTGMQLKVKLFNNNATYLITGGMGGIGMEVAKWMANSGAKHIILVGRNPPKKSVSEEIQSRNSQGSNIICMQCDIGNFEECQDLLNLLRAEELPQLRGIMHAAGVLSDGTFENQIWENYEKVFNPKVRGGWNLHKLTLDYPLEHFVMFSSGVSNFGSVAQGNHTAANFYLDALAHYRYSIGLPATTVNWGQWGQVGVAANLEMSGTGVRPFTAFQGISALEAVIKHQRLQTTVIEADFHVLSKMMPTIKLYTIEIATSQQEGKADLKLSPEKFWKEYDAAETDEQRQEVIRVEMHLVLRHILKLDKDDVIEDDATFQDMGMDSLMMIEMKNALQSLVRKKVKITLNSVKDCNTVNMLCKRLTQLISGKEEQIPLTPEELAKLIEEDSVLPQEICPTGLPECEMEHIHTAFLTGATGNLGPFVLLELSRRPQVKKIICLVRKSKDGQTSLDRIKKILTDRELINQIRFDIIEVLEGDITQTNFGVEEATYTKLSSDVDAIVHLSTNANVLEYYNKSESMRNNTRAVNVIGIKNVIEFACAIKTKHLFGGSSVVAVVTLDEDDTLKEDWPGLDEFKDLPNTGYPISKFIADRLMAQAAERGLPCKVFRFPEIGGHSRNGGGIDIFNNHLILRMMTYMHIGAVPAVPVPFTIVPVDICADISCRIFFNPNAPLGVYNLLNPFPEDEQLIEDLGNEFGYSVERVEVDEFIEKVKNLDESDLLILAKRAVNERAKDKELMEENTPAPFTSFITNKKKIFRSKKLEAFISEYPSCMENSLSLLKKDLEYAKKCGMFKKFGLK